MTRGMFITMHTLQFHFRVGADGVLNFTLPLGPGEANSDVLVTIQVADERFQPISPMPWQEFLDETYGSCAELELDRGPQGEYETREALD
jgi:hypothetical protein